MYIFAFLESDFMDSKEYSFLQAYVKIVVDIED